jgi:uncharacterized damage-inducible protein DinB
MCRTDKPTATASEAGDFSERLTTLAAMPERLAALFATIPEAQWKTRPASGFFSLAEHACHLRDIEIEAYRARLERMLAGACPALADLDGAALAAARDYPRQDARTARYAFAAVRADMVSRLSSLTIDGRARTGLLEGVGEITVEGLVAKMLEHDAEHLAELAALRDELAGR